MRLLGAGLIALLLSGCASALRWDGGAPEGHYEVRRGDTLYSIAVRHDLDYRELARWNGIGGSYTIYPGQLLRLSPEPGRSTTRVAQAPAAGASPSSAGSGGASRPQRQEPAPGSATPAGGSSGAAAAASGSGGAAGPRRWQWPLQGEIVRGFAPPESKGIDIAASEGTPIRAAAAGSVVYSGSALKGYGELIIIKHDDTWLTAYGYNRRRRAEEGQRVAAGEVIGEVGLGPAQKPMLHFEIRRAGQPTDPLRLLPRGG